MERIRKTLKARQRSTAYEALDDGSGNEPGKKAYKRSFVWLEYAIFCLLGIAMLWAWNMFLAASPYFQHRFSPSPKLLRAFPPTLLSVSTVTSLVSTSVLTKLQLKANYPNRIILALIINVGAFTLLAISTVAFQDVRPGVYFTFLMLIVFASSLATGLCQNGVFAYVSGFGINQYTQAIMTGQAVAGVLPCIAQIVSVLSLPAADHRDAETSDGPVPKQSSKSAFAYFLTATAVTIMALVAFFILLRKYPVDTIFSTGKQTADIHNAYLSNEDDNDDDHLPPTRKVVSLWTLFLKLRYLALAVFLNFIISMFFPVFTQQITSTHSAPVPSRLLEPACFIPLAFLFWNTGDLLGRLLTLLPLSAKLIRYPFAIFILSILRVVWIPLYLLCNIHGRRGLGHAVANDFFYLVVVQLLFGISSGYLGSLCMMGAGDWVDEDEREAAGGFMVLCLIGGLSVGSLASFAVA